MTLLVLNTDDWSAPVTSAASPIVVQARTGSVFMAFGTAAPVAGSSDALLLDSTESQNDSTFVVPPGATVRFRRGSGKPAVVYHAPMA